MNGNSWIDVITVIITIVLCIRNAKKITYNSRYIIYFVFVFLYVFPILLDCIYLAPGYISYRYQGYKISSNDFLTRCIYDLFVLYTQIIILNFNKKKDTLDISIKNEGINNNETNNYIPILTIGTMLAPLFVILLSNSYFILYTPQWREVYELNIPNYSLIEKLSYVGVMCSVILFFDQHMTKIRSKVFFALTGYLNICVEGKRSILFFCLLASLLCLIPGIRNENLDRRERIKKLLWFGLAVVAVITFVAVFSLYVKVNSRGYDLLEQDYLYTTIRVDIFRDDRVRMAIFSLLHPDQMRIIEYPGQTILPMFLYLFPIDIVTNFLFHYSPKSYSAYLSAALIGGTVDSTKSFMTPSVAGEIISNFGYFGIFIFPFFCFAFVKMINKAKYPYNIMVSIAFIALQMYAFSYMAYVLEFIILVFCLKNVKFRFRR